MADIVDKLLAAVGESTLLVSLMRLGILQHGPDGTSPAQASARTRTISPSCASAWATRSSHSGSCLTPTSAGSGTMRSMDRLNHDTARQAQSRHEPRLSLPGVQG